MCRRALSAVGARLRVSTWDAQQHHQDSPDVATAVSGIIEQSWVYLKLTPESAKRPSRTLAVMADAAGGIANGNILLHTRAARSVIGSHNASSEIVDELHAPPGIESRRNSLAVVPWRGAPDNPQA